MTNDPANHNRRSIRLRGFDYAQEGAYFVTICISERQCLLGDVVDGTTGLNDAGRMVQAIWDELPLRFVDMKLDDFVVMPNHIHGIFVLPGRGESCIRPVTANHTKGDHKDHTKGDHKDHTKGDHKDHTKGDHKDHTKGDHKDRPYGTLPGTVGRIVQAFKSITTHEYSGGVKQNGWAAYPGKLWQRNYWEHVIRNEPEFQRIRAYIQNNPAQWDSDKLNPTGAMHASSPHQIREPSLEYVTEGWRF